MGCKEEGCGEGGISLIPWGQLAAAPLHSLPSLRGGGRLTALLQLIYLFLHPAAEFQRMGNLGERLRRTARAAHSDCAEAVSAWSTAMLSIFASVISVERRVRTPLFTYTRLFVTAISVAALFQ